MTTNINLKIEEEVLRVLDELKNEDVTTEKYKIAAANIKLLSEAMTEEVVPPTPEPMFDMNTVIVAATNIIGLLLIMNYERLNIITTKSFGLLVKPRL